MDQEECWVRFWDAVAEGDYDEAGWSLLDLEHWIVAGGAAPAGLVTTRNQLTAVRNLSAVLMGQAITRML
jgi:hypothetical protein